MIEWLPSEGGDRAGRGRWADQPAEGGPDAEAGREVHGGGAGGQTTHHTAEAVHAAEEAAALVRMDQRKANLVEVFRGDD